MEGTRLSLSQQWVIGKRIGSGGFGEVWEAVSGDQAAAIKFIPKAPGAERELLFVDLDGARNIVPVVDSGENGASWIIVMARADKSLRQHLEGSGGSLAIDEVLRVLCDVCDALTDLDGRVVHRDLKPENVLLLAGHWCLADFGISRYAASTTAPDTHKFALTPAYAAPERWRNERATAATDIYSVGVMAYELLEGQRPFPGPSTEDWREQHLHHDAPGLADVPAALDALVGECLYKAPDARPRAADVRARLLRVATQSMSSGLALLQEANRGEVQRMSLAAREKSEQRTSEERRRGLLQAAQMSFGHISATLQESLASAAPAAHVAADRGGGWNMRIGDAALSLASMRRHATSDWGGWNAPAFTVVATSSVNLHVSGAGRTYEGRSHCLWFGDVQAENEFAWHESAFMFSPLIGRSARQEPFSLDPGEQAAKAVWTGMAEYQVAWPFTPLVIGDLDAFVSRWAEWFARAVQGTLSHPTQMPEYQSQGSWRR